MTGSFLNRPTVLPLPLEGFERVPRATFSVEEKKRELMEALSLRANQGLRRDFPIQIARKRRSLKRYYRFSPFYHPLMMRLKHIFYLQGIPGILSKETQNWVSQNLSINVNPQQIDYVEPIAQEGIDFSREGAYSIYNWELFFHVPFFIACQLSQNQRFEEAQKWFHFIFDPIGGAFFEKDPTSAWKTKPFFEAAEAKKQELEIAEKLMQGVNRSISELERQVSAWREHPFQPHLLARMRHTTYQKRVFMKYLDNLIAWGDSLFRRDTMESINEATLYYVLAAKLLGKKPQKVAPLKSKPRMSYRELKKYQIDAFSNASIPLIEAENFIPRKIGLKIRLNEAQAIPFRPLLKKAPPSLPTSLYFGIPQNENLLKYWDTVADRLFKIRNGMNIEGVLRSLDLFEPPIDPGLLVKAAAKGLNIREVLNDASGPPPIYRFPTMVQKALDLCNEVKSLGGALLSAIEKKEGEALALLRSQHEMKMLDLVKEIKKKQIEEIDQTIEGLKKSKESATERYNYYANIEKINNKESTALSHMKTAFDLQVAQNSFALVASALTPIPDFKVGSPTTIGVTVGSPHISGVPRLVSEALGAIANGFNSQASIASTEAGHERRWEDWKLQQRLSRKDEENTDRQIAAAEIRKAVAEKELQNHEVQIQNTQEVNEYMHSKFTNEQLYHWMKGQLSGLYFQVYKLAYDIAKRAEKAYGYELGVDLPGFIQFGHWDSLRSGLLAGEKLAFDLKRLEMSYFEENKRDYEIVKNISLASFAGDALLELRKTGTCELSITEELLDLDFPTHVMRRIKGVSLSIPCVVGPYTNINCKLSLTNHETRKQNGERAPGSGGASIVASGGVNDSGLFEFNFRDERLLPFEGMGVISKWTIGLPEHRQFDYHTISDVILHIRYTAKEGEKRETASVPRKRLFSIKHEFSSVWQTLLRSSENTLLLNLTPERFLFADRGKKCEITESNTEIFAESEGKYEPVGFKVNPSGIELTHLNREGLKDLLMVFSY